MLDHTPEARRNARAIPRQTMPVCRHRVYYGPPQNAHTPSMMRSYTSCAIEEQIFAVQGIESQRIRGTVCCKAAKAAFH